MLKGLISDIQRFAIHDGPGIRTTVFFKGCPLNCRWCANPETIEPRPEIMFSPGFCMQCGICAQTCPQNAVTFTPGELPVRDRELCISCGSCAEACPKNALLLRGTLMAVDEIMAVLEKDLPFFKRSGGGVTLSGGEPFRQPEPVGEILRLCAQRGMHTAVDTCGCVAWEAIEPSLEHIDLFLYDLKHLDPKAHKQGTGVTNELILANLGRIQKSGKKVIVSLPLIPGFNDSSENLTRTAVFVAELGITELRVLPYHTYGRGKYQKIGRENSMSQIPALEPAEAEKAKEILEKYIPKVAVGG